MRLINFIIDLLDGILYTIKYGEKKSKQRVYFFISFVLIFFIGVFLIGFFVIRYHAGGAVPVQSYVEDSNEDEFRDDKFSDKPNVISIGSNMYYDRDTSQIVIYKKLLKDAELIESDFDNYFQYSFQLNFLKSYRNTTEIDSELISEISLEENIILVKSKRIIAFMHEEDSDYIYIKAVTPKEKYKKIVVIDPGHGGNDVGANREDILEKEINLRIYQHIAELFKGNEEIKIYSTRKEDLYVEYENRSQIANLTADFAISLHNNDFETVNQSISGTEVVYSKNNNEPVTNEKMAEIMLECIVKETKSKSRGILENDKLYVLNHATIPTVLVEIGFMSNPEELLLLNSDEYQQKIAKGIYNGILTLYENFEF